MNDRFLSGFYAGTAGGVLMNLVALAAKYVLRFSEGTYVDWAAILLYGNKASNAREAAYALVIHVVWSGILGVVLAYVISVLSSRHYLVKAWLFAITVWFMIDGITSLFNRAPFAVTRLGTSVAYFLGASTFGLTAGFVLQRLERSPNAR